MRLCDGMRAGQRSVYCAFFDMLTPGQHRRYSDHSLDVTAVSRGRAATCEGRQGADPDSPCSDGRGRVA